MHSALFWLFLIFFFLAIEAFYNMIEMAIVSFNKVRLQYYVNKGKRRALWIYSLIQKPSRFFGTTLLGMTITLQVGSECARQFYQALDINPDWALVTQFFLVVIVAELAPIFAARRYAEHVSMLGAPFIYFSSLAMAPIVFICGVIANWINRLLGGTAQEPGLFLNREELQRLVEEVDEQPLVGKKENLNLIVNSIFQLKNKVAKHVMTPLHSVKMISSTSTIAEMRHMLTKTDQPHLPIYQRYRTHIIAIASPRDLLRLPDNRKVREYAKSPWFIAEQTNILQILKQFRHNNQDLAIVLDDKGKPVGLLSLDDLLDEIFGERLSSSPPIEEPAQLIIERSLPAELSLEEFNKTFHVHLAIPEVETLEELMIKYLGSHPGKGESIRVERFEFTIEESSILGIKTISVKTIL